MIGSAATVSKSGLYRAVRDPAPFARPMHAFTRARPAFFGLGPGNRVFPPASKIAGTVPGGPIIGPIIRRPPPGRVTDGAATVGRAIVSHVRA